MTRLSSTTLFNFTDKLEFLLSNLQEGIYCNASIEKLPQRNAYYRVPMACFCDIPLSLIKEHFSWYGRYGIGIRRTYARSLGVKPVWYITSENSLVNKLSKTKELSEQERKHLLPYLKQFIGYQADKEGKQKRKKFYDEREWRYLPDNNLVEPLFGLSKISEAVLPFKKSHNMPLDPCEIEYIIIELEKDMEPLLKVLKKLSLKHELGYESLVSKIMTAKQIERDF